MKTLFIETKNKESIGLFWKIKKQLNKLPKKIFLAYSIQYKPLALKIKEYLKKQNKEIKGFKQVLGCSELKSKFPMLLVSSGNFHALNLVLQNNKVFLLDKEKIKKIDNKEINKIKLKRKSALLKFLSAETIGILISCKPGQENLSEARELKRKLEKKGKRPRIFLADNITPLDLENFNIDSWVNTACPGLSMDSNKIINIKELKKKNYFA